LIYLETKNKNGPAGFVLLLARTLSILQDPGFQVQVAGVTVAKNLVREYEVVVNGIWIKSHAYTKNLSESFKF
jgi:hypothetical protein